MSNTENMWEKKHNHEASLGCKFLCLKLKGSPHMWTSSRTIHPVKVLTISLSPDRRGKHEEKHKNYLHLQVTSSRHGLPHPPANGSVPTTFVFRCRLLISCGGHQGVHVSCWSCQAGTRGGQVRCGRFLDRENSILKIAIVSSMEKVRLFNQNWQSTMWSEDRDEKTQFWNLR